MTDRARARAQAKVLNKLRTLPLVAAAVKSAGVPRSTYYRWCKEDPVFAYLAMVAQESGREAVNDLAESNVIRGVQEQDMAATKYWLSHNSERYSVRPIPQAQPPDGLGGAQKSAIEVVEERVLEIHGDLVRRWLEDIEMQPEEQRQELMMDLIEYIKQARGEDGLDWPDYKRDDTDDES